MAFFQMKTLYEALIIAAAMGNRVQYDVLKIRHIVQHTSGLYVGCQMAVCNTMLTTYDLIKIHTIF